MGLQPDIIVAYTHNISDGGIRVHKLPRAGETVRRRVDTEAQRVICA